MNRTTVSTIVLASFVTLVTFTIGTTAFGDDFAAKAPQKSNTITDGRNQISIMTYNVDNLFDTQHDAGKDDWAYLPLAFKKTSADVQAACAAITVFPWRKECQTLDWNQNTYEHKLANVAAVIQSVNNGRGPDILILDEIENIGVLHKLNSEYLRNSGYQTEILIEGNDDRGIDQAILSRLPLLQQPANFPMPLVSTGADGSRKDASKTRGLLTALLQLPDGQHLRVYAVHLPSGDVHDLRAQAIDFINKTRPQYSLPNEMVAIGGDFNINSKEDQQFNMWQGAMKDWAISNVIGCQGCVGTEYYRSQNEWSFLDAIGVSHNMEPSGNAPWAVIPASIQVITDGPQQVNAQGFPQVYDAVQMTGVTDHFPVFEVMQKR